MPHRTAPVHRIALHRGVALVATLALAAFSAGVLAASYPPALERAVHEGAKLFHSTSLGANGMSCQSCHLNGGRTEGRLPNGKKIPSLRNAAAIFPRYSKKAGYVRTMTMQINHCIEGGLGGMPLSADSPKMVALDSYFHALAAGRRIHMNAKPH